MIRNTMLFCLTFLYATIGYSSPDSIMYLDNNLKLTENQTDIVCYIDEEYSRAEIAVYRCYNSNNELSYQVVGGFYLTQELVESKEFYDYLKPAQGDKIKPFEMTYLVGCYKNEKPMNGFFIPENKDSDVNEWIIFDFYENGIRTEQVYNNFFKTFLEGWSDNEYTWYSLNGKSIYKNEVLIDGVKITEVRESGATVQIADNIENGKSVGFTIGIFAMHYGEFVNIKTTDNGYVLNTPLSNQVLNVCYHENGRTLEFINNESDEKIEVAYYNQRLSEFNPSDLKEEEEAKYFELNDEIYVERQKNPERNINDEWREKDISDILTGLSQSFGVKYVAISSERILEMLKNQNRLIDSNMLGSIALYDGKLYGIKYKEGKANGTYTIVFTDGDKEKVYAENKTIDELLQLIHTHQQVYEEEVIYEY